MMLLFPYAILGVAVAAMVGVVADLAYVGLRKVWRMHQKYRAIRRTAALCRLYGFTRPTDDERDSIATFRKIHKR